MDVVNFIGCQCQYHVYIKIMVYVRRFVKNFVWLAKRFKCTDMISLAICWNEIPAPLNKSVCIPQYHRPAADTE